MEVSIAMRRGLPVSSNFRTANFESAIRAPGPISLYILVFESASFDQAGGLRNTHESP